MIYKLLMIFGLLAIFFYLFSEQRVWKSLEKKAYDDVLELDLPPDNAILTLNSRLARTAHVSMCGYATLLVIPVAWLSVLLGEYVKAGSTNKVASLILVVFIYMVVQLIREERSKYFRHMSSVTNSIALAYESESESEVETTAIEISNLDALPAIDYNMVMNDVRTNIKAASDKPNRINPQ